MHTLEVSASAVLIQVRDFPLCCLTCGTGGTPYSDAYFGAGTGPIYLDDVACTSNASQLLECGSRPILVHDCDHSADSGVGCEGVVLFVCLLQLVSTRYNNESVLSHCFSSMHNWSTATSRR